MKLQLPLTFLAIAAIAAAGCDDRNPYAPDQSVTPDTLVAFSLTGTPPTSPSGLALTLRSTVRVDGSGTFDVAFDFDAQGRVIVYPVRTIVSAIASTPSVGIQVEPAGTFDAITSAPSGYYRPDTAVVVTPGTPFVILTQRTTQSITCLINSPSIYAKVVIDSVFPSTTRAIYMRVTTNPNCGSRSLSPGIPSE